MSEARFHFSEAKCKPNTAGAITSHCGLQNHPELRVSKLIFALELTAPLAEISVSAEKPNQPRFSVEGPGGVSFHENT